MMSQSTEFKMGLFSLVGVVAIAGAIFVLSGSPDSECLRKPIVSGGKMERYMMESTLLRVASIAGGIAASIQVGEIEDEDIRGSVEKLLEEMEMLKTEMEE